MPLQPKTRDSETKEAPHDQTEWKTAVITGGASGIGLAAAKRFIEGGAFVFIFGRRQDALDAAVAELGPNARGVQGSVSDVADLDRLYAAMKAGRGTPRHRLRQCRYGKPACARPDHRRAYRRNLRHQCEGHDLYGPAGPAAYGSGRVDHLTGSSAGTTGATAFSAYGASKAAVRNLARTWAEDLKGTGIRVNVLMPSAVATELAEAALGEAGLKDYGSMTALQHMGDPAEIGAVALFSPRGTAVS